MEDAHIAEEDLTTISNVATGEPLSIFGVFDGHGGNNYDY